MKPPAHVTVTSKSSASRSVPAGTPSRVLVIVSSPVSRWFSNAASAIEAESVTISCGLVVRAVQPVVASSVIEHSVPGGSSGVSGVAQVPVCPLVVIVSTVECSTVPSAAVQVMSKMKLSSRSSGFVVGPKVALVIANVLVVFVIGILLPVVATTTSSPTVVAKRESGVSTAEHSAPVGTSSRTNGALTENWPATVYGSGSNPPTQVTVMSKRKASRSVPAGTPSRVLVMVRSPVSRSFVNDAVTTPSESTVRATPFGEVSVQPAGAACSVTVQFAPLGSAGMSEYRRKPVAVVAEVTVLVVTVWVPE